MVLLPNNIDSPLLRFKQALRAKLAEKAEKTKYTYQSTIDVKMPKDEKNHLNHFEDVDGLRREPAEFHTLEMPFGAIRYFFKDSEDNAKQGQYIVLSTREILDVNQVFGWLLTQAMPQQFGCYLRRNLIADSSMPEIFIADSKSWDSEFLPSHLRKASGSTLANFRSIAGTKTASSSNIHHKFTHRPSDAERAHSLKVLRKGTLHLIPEYRLKDIGDAKSPQCSSLFGTKRYKGEWGTASLIELPPAYTESQERNHEPDSQVTDLVLILKSHLTHEMRSVLSSLAGISSQARNECVDTDDLRELGFRIIY